MNNFYEKKKENTERKSKGSVLEESEDTYRKLYEEAPIAYFSIGADKIIKNCNNAASNLLGYTKAELVEKSEFDLYADTPEGLPKAKEIFKQFLKGKMILNEEFQMKKKNGELIWISLTVNPIINDKGNIVETRSMVVNISERKKAEIQLKESEENFQSLFEHMTAGFAYHKIILDVNNNPINYVFLEANPAFEELTGLNVDEIIGKSVTEVLPGIENDPTDWIGKYGKVALTGISLTFESYAQPLDQWYSVTAYSPKKDYFAVTFTNITERKKAEQRIKDSEREYRYAFNRNNLYKDIFTHDINNILQNILTSLELTKLYSNDPDRRKDFREVTNLIQEQVIRGKNLVENVQKLSEVEEKGWVLSSIDALNILERSIQVIKESFPHKVLKIEIQSTQDEFFVNADESLVTVFENILSNAIKHNNNPKKEILIKISKYDLLEDKLVKFEFLDNGNGIPDSMKDTIFIREYKKSEVPSGIGLGLLLIKRLIEIYNGEVKVEDRIKGDYKQGSNFVILIPEAL